jgi:monoamine oxidase
VSQDYTVPDYNNVVPGYEVWIQPQGRIFLAGDHTSHIVGWQEGAALSAHRAVNMIGARVAKA